MNKIICDNCKEEIKQTKNLIETKFIKGAININFFRCKKCGIKTLIDVTDHEVREKVIELRKWVDARKKSLDIVIDGMSEENLKEVALLVDITKYNMDKLTNEIKEAKRVLKEKYEGEL